MTIKRHQREELAKLTTSELIDYVMKLEEQFTSDSTNSSKPPSRDSAAGREKRKAKKNKSLRKSGERKPGGQKGHPGATLQPTDDPDTQIDLVLDQCPCCQGSLSEKDQTGKCVKRQVFDLPKPPPLESTQYNALEYHCDNCECLIHAEFPDGVNAPVQYGSRLAAWLVYMKDELLLPFKRIETFFRDLMDVPISSATIDQARKTIYQNLEQWEQALIKKLINEDVLGADESGLRVNQDQYWLHVASTELLTHYAVQKRRGKEGMNAIGILPNFRGRMIHDYLPAYLSYEQCDHGLCNQHHLRDLQAVGEMAGQSWAGQMAEVLQAMLHCRHEHEARETTPSGEEFTQWQNKYEALLKIAEAENPMPPEPPPLPNGKKKRGRKKKGKARNLFERFRDKTEEILSFFRDFRVPFTNNQAEQDIRMIKVQQKVSGCFRTKQGAERFARIRSYLSTMRKQKQNLFEGLQAAIEGSPKSELRGS
jgi:transposase